MDRDQKIQDFRQKISELHEKYIFDRRELSKIVFITSAALFVVSVNSVMTLQDTRSSLASASNQMDEARAVLESENFQEAMNTLEKVRSGRVSSQLDVAKQSFDDLEGSFSEVENTEEQLDTTIETYQWMSLISIVGMVTGVGLWFS